MLIRDGYLAVLPDGSLNPREPLSRGRALHSISRLLEARGLLQLQRATARPTADDNLILRSTKGNINRLVEILSRLTSRTVTNNTGLAGEYDFTLQWVPDQDIETEGAPLFTALQEQIGLKLESIKRPVEVIVIDRIERPSEN